MASATSRARINAFLEMQAVERAASENTLAAYRRDLNDAESFLSAREIGRAHV